MSTSALAFPPAPTHRLSESGTFFVTAGTYQKRHHFRTADRLDVLQRGLLRMAADFGWQLEAWAVFSNHYHLVGHAPAGQDGGESLRAMLGQLHERTGQWVGGKEGLKSGQVWFNFWETNLTYEGSYLARLEYVHQNAVKHGLVQRASDYPWCSAEWFVRVASSKQKETLSRLRKLEVNVVDDYRPELAAEGERASDSAAVAPGMQAGG